jgi:hypothetical protein
VGEFEVAIPGGIWVAIGAQEDFTFCRQAEMALSQNRLDDAVPLYKRCLKDGNLSTATTSVVYRNLGLIFFNKKEYSQSISFFDDAIRLNGKDPWDDLVSRGNSWASAGDSSKAFEDYEAALKLMPSFAPAYFNRGITYERLGKLVEAEKDFLEARDKGLRSPQLNSKLSFYRMTLRESSKSDPLAPFTSDNDFLTFLGFFVVLEIDRTICSEYAQDTAAFARSILGGPNFNSYRSANRRITATGIYTSSPCPFSPDRRELKPVDSKDLEGVWLFPKSSQKYRFGSKSLAWQADSRSSIQCEVIGFFSGGEMRRVTQSGQNSSCEISNAAEFELIRTSPSVSSWSLIGKGRVSVARTDVKNYVEEWDAFIATADFIASGLEVRKGDLVSYLRRENGNDLNASLSFRHLKRLP